MPQYPLTPNFLQPLEARLRSSDANWALLVSAGVTLELLDRKIPGSTFVTGMITLGAGALQLYRNGRSQSAQ